MGPVGVYERSCSDGLGEADQLQLGALSQGAWRRMLDY